MECLNFCRKIVNETFIFSTQPYLQIFKVCLISMISQEKKCGYCKWQIVPKLTFVYLSCLVCNFPFFNHNINFVWIKNKDRSNPQSFLLKPRSDNLVISKETIIKRTIFKRKHYIPSTLCNW
jgi:hypothetical protein